MDDGELLRRFARQHSAAAFSELVCRYVDFVFAAAQRRVGGDAHAAQDIVQQVFLELARHGARLEGRTVLAGWLYGVTRNKAAHFVRAERRRARRHLEAHIMNDNESGAENGADWERLRPAIDEAFAALPPRDRDAVILRFFQKKSYKEIGARLALSPGAARLRVERALERMRPVFSRRGISSTAAAVIAALGAEAAVIAPAGLAAEVAAQAGVLAAGAGAGLGGAAATWIQLMSINKTAALAAAAILSVGIGGAVRQERINRELARRVTAQRAVERTCATLRTENAALAKALADANALEASNRARAAQVAKLPSIQADIRTLRTRLAARPRKKFELSARVQAEYSELQALIDAKRWQDAESLTTKVAQESPAGSYDRFLSEDTLAKIYWQCTDNLSGAVAAWQAVDEMLQAHPEYFSPTQTFDHGRFETDLNYQIALKGSNALPYQWFPSDPKS